MINPLDKKTQRLLSAARWVLDDIQDREEDRGDDGKEFSDIKELRLAIRAFKETHL